MTIVTSKRNVNVNVNPLGLAIWGRERGRKAGTLHIEEEGYIHDTAIVTAQPAPSIYRDRGSCA